MAFGSSSQKKLKQQQQWSLETTVAAAAAEGKDGHLLQLSLILWGILDISLTFFGQVKNKP